MALSDLEMSNMSTTSGPHSPTTTTHDEEMENSCCESEEEYQRPELRKNGSQKMKRYLSREDSEGQSLQINPGQAEPNTPMQSYNEQRMRRNLQFFFMNPIEKWKAKRRFPYKFCVQVAKIILVTIQLCLFAHSRYNHVNYTWGNKVSFSHLFLKGWDATMEITAYPPSSGQLAIYLNDEFYETIDYAIRGYTNLNSSIGPYSYPNEDNELAPMRLCLHQYKQGEIFGFNESYVFNPEIETTCLNLTHTVLDKGSVDYLQSKEVVVSFSALVYATIEFSIKTVNFKSASPISAPDCYQFNITILFDNRDHDGQMLLSLDAEPDRLHCKGSKEFYVTSKIDEALGTMLNMFVIIICVCSFLLCFRAVYRAQLLLHSTSEFFRAHFERELSFEGKMEFFNFW